MSELSPQAQAVLDALCMDELNGPQQLMARAHAAAALRAAGDQMAAYNSKKFLYSIADHWKLRAIAAELENHQ